MHRLLEYVSKCFWSNLFLLEDAYCILVVSYRHLMLHLCQQLTFLALETSEVHVNGQVTKYRTLVPAWGSQVCMGVCIKS